MRSYSRVLIFGLAIAFVASQPIAANSSAADDSPKDLIRKAARSNRRGAHTDAEKHLRRAIEIEPDNSAAKVELAFSLAKQRRLIEAYDMIVPVAEAEPQNARALSVLGTTLLFAGRFRDARTVFYKALRIDKRDHLAWAGYGMVDFYENRLGDSLDKLGQAVFIKPREPDYLFALAQVSARAERYRTAADNYSAFLQHSHIEDAERRARIKGLITFLRVLGQTDGLYVSKGKDQTSVPFELVGNRPVINVKINGSDEPLRFVLDTGSGISVLSEETAKRIGIRPITRGGFARGIGGDGKFEMVYSLLREIEIGDVAVRTVPVYLRKLHSDSERFDGYIGLSLISKFLTTIDYGDRTFSLTKKDFGSVDPNENASLSLPLRLTSSGFLSGEVTLEGLESPLNFIVDTGASVSVISDRVARGDEVSRWADTGRMRVIGSAGVKEDVPTFLLPSVKFGNHTRKDIMAVALDLDLINEASGWEQSGILGGNFLKNYRLTFDFRNSKVTFVAVAPERE